MRHLTTLLTIIILAASCTAQTTTNGALRQSSVVVTNEQDLAAMRIHHYGNPNIVESPAAWFQTDGAGTITNFLYQAGRESVVIPWLIDGVPLTSIGDRTFTVYDENQDEYTGKPITSVTTPQCVTNINASAFRVCSSLQSAFLPGVKTIGPAAFFGCDALTRITLPSTTSIRYDAFAACSLLSQVTLPAIETIEEYAFSGLPALTAIYFSANAPSIGTGIYDSTPSVTNYVTSPTATGWGTTFGEMPVVRTPLTATSLTVGGTNVMSELAKSVVYNSNGRVVIGPIIDDYQYKLQVGGRFRLSDGTNGVIQAMKYTSSGGQYPNYATTFQSLMLNPLGGNVVIGNIDNHYDELIVNGITTSISFIGNGSGLTGITAAQVGATAPADVTNIVRAVDGWLTYSNLTGSVTITNQFEAPIAILGTGAVSVVFSGLRAPRPLYFTAQGFTSLTFPAGSYLVGGGMWQTNRVNHFCVWQYSTNLFINPLVSTEILP